MLDDCIQNLMAEMHIPGMSIAVVQAGEPVPIKSYGFANIEPSIPASERTVYEIINRLKYPIAWQILWVKSPL